MTWQPDYSTTELCLGAVPRFHDAPEWIYDLDNPYLHGAYAPIVNTVDATALPVEGELPNDLTGAYLRNGPNPLHKPRFRHHPFDGDGMIHGVYFNNGGASYRNRYVNTAALEQERACGESVSPGVMGPFDYQVSEFGIKDTANTDVCFYAGDVLALWYNAGHPYRLDPLTLETRGEFSIEGRLERRLSAHPKTDPATGELLFFNYGDEPPYLVFGIADVQGKLIRQLPIDLPGPRLPHDIGFTRDYAILHDLPLFHDVEVLRRHRVRALTFHRDLPARFGVIRRDGSQSQPHWFECEPCYILHVTNCWQAGDWVVMDGCRSVNPMPGVRPGEGELASMLAYMRLESNAYRWRFNLRTGEVREGDVDTLNTEFNKANTLYAGREGRYAYHQRIPTWEEGGHTLRFTGLVKYDNETGCRQQWHYGEGVYGSEAVYAPQVGVSAEDREDSGYVITIATDSKDWSSRALVFAAADIESGPVARVSLPQRVPAGFHATWVKGSDLYT
ncbi:MAG: carotenoid oxygenase family protein [Pseudomonadota bacterium]